MTEDIFPRRRGLWTVDCGLDSGQIARSLQGVAVQWPCFMTEAVPKAYGSQWTRSAMLPAGNEPGRKLKLTD